MKRLITNGLFAAFLLASTTQAAEPCKSVDDFNGRIQPMLKKYCYECHGRKETEGKVKLTEISSWKDLIYR